MATYILSQSTRHYAPDYNVRSLAASLRAGAFEKGDTIILPASFMNGLIEKPESLSEVIYVRTQAALGRLVVGTKRTGLRLLCPVAERTGYRVFEVMAGSAQALAVENFAGGFRVSAPAALAPYDLIFKTAAMGEDYAPDYPASYIEVEGQAFSDEGQVWLGECRQVRHKRVQANFIASDRVVCLEEGGVALLDEHHRRFSAMRVALGEYMARIGFKSVTIGLSGGLDSAIVAAVAVSVLGPERVNVFALPSRYTSEESFTDARELCANLGLTLRMIDIMPAFNLMRETVHEKLPFGTETGLMQENLQARIRGNYLMALSNADGSLVLNTGNKSELAVGYCTLYGDMVGGLALLSDVYKSDLYAMCQRVIYLKERIPVNILTKAPTAELRDNQKDEDSLPAYEVLDDVLKLMIEEGLSGEKLRKRKGADLAKRVVTLARRAQFKYRLAPLGVQMTSKPLRCLPADYFAGLMPER